MRGKKGQVLSSLGNLGIGIASFTILIAVIFLVIAQTKEQIATVDTNMNANNETECDKSTACNATRELQNATADIPGWVPLIVIVSIGGLILGLVAAFGGRS